MMQSAKRLQGKVARLWQSRRPCTCCCEDCKYYRAGKTVVDYTKENHLRTASSAN